jgi:protein-S-isoprenylcysteine O-methyltransferase Ste14
VSALQSKHGGARVRFPPPLVFLGLAAIGFVLDWIVWPLAVPIATTPRIAIGAVPSLAGVALIAWSLGLFTRNDQDPRPWMPSPSLILQGPYRHTRNPMYVGMTAIHVGLGIGLGNLWILLFAPLALLVVHIIAVLPEEAYLCDRFGADYERYRSSVRRYV